MTTELRRLLTAAHEAYAASTPGVQAGAVIIVTHETQALTLAGIEDPTGPSMVVSGEGLVGVLVLGRPTTWVRRRLLSLLDGPAAVSTVIHSVDELAPAVKTTALALQELTSPERRVVLVGEHLPELMALQAPDALAHLVRRLAEPILRLGDDSAELIETAYWFLRLDSSVSATARLMRTHRNTIRNRIDRLSSTTGVGLDRHRDRVLWSLALLALGRHDVLRPARAAQDEAA